MKSIQHTFLQDKLAQYQNDELSSEEKEIIDQWFEERWPSHTTEFPKDENAAAQLGLELLSRLKASLAEETSAAAHRLYRNEDNKPGQNDHPQSGRIYRLSYKWLSIACAILLLAGIPLLYWYNSADGVQTAAAAGRTFRTANGKVQKITLQDGTEIWMNAGTTIRVAPGFSNSALRQVYLEQGEAFFKVKRDTLRPFSIATKNLLTTVLGTSFNIRAYPDAQVYQVAVSTGKVKVAQKHNGAWTALSAGLLKGDVLSYHTASGKTEIETRNTALISNWKTSRSIYADGLTMSQIGQEISRQYVINVTVKPGIHQDLTYHLTLPHQDLKILLQQLAAATGISYQLNNSQIIINPATE